MLSVKHQSDTKSFLLGRTKPLHVLKDIDTDIDIDFFDKYSSDWNTIDLNKGGSVTFKYEWSPKNCGLYHRLRLEKVKKQDLLNNVKNRLISHHVQTQELKKAQQKFYHKGSIVVPDPYGFLDLKSNRQTFDFSLKEDIGVNMGHEDWDTQIVTGVNPKSKCGEKCVTSSSFFFSLSISLKNILVRLDSVLTLSLFTSPTLETNHNVGTG